MLVFIGSHGKTAEALAANFPGFDIAPLVEKGYVEVVPTPTPVLEGQAADDLRGAPETVAPYYVLTPLGRAHAGLPSP